MRRKFTKLLAAATATALLIPSVIVNAKDVSNYTDVSPDAWYYEYVADVSSQDLMTGYEDGRFGVTDTLARGQFATVLYRMDGQPETGYTGTFPDVADGQFYSSPAEWAKVNNIITGYENGNFGPADEITREQLVTIMYRYAESRGEDVSAKADYTSFPDGASVSGFASEAMQWAVAEEIIKGNGSDQTLDPQGTVSRAVCATIISRFIGNNGETTNPSEYTYVLNTSTWKFHIPSCRDVKKIIPENYAASSESRDDLIAQGYSPCGHCHP